MNVYLDPGHGGRDPGAIGRDPATAQEADIVWAVSLVLAAELERRGVDVTFSRAFGRTDRTIRLADRAAEANAIPADVFLSIHCNSFTDPAAHGVEVLHFGSETGTAISEQIREAMRREGLIGAGALFRDRGLKIRSELAVLRLTSMPAALVELPFLSNRANLTRLLDAKTQIRFARAIASGAIDFLR